MNGIGGFFMPSWLHGLANGKPTPSRHSRASGNPGRLYAAATHSLDSRLRGNDARGVCGNDAEAESVSFGNDAKAVARE